MKFPKKTGMLFLLGLFMILCLNAVSAEQISNVSLLPGTSPSGVNNMSGGENLTHFSMILVNSTINGTNINVSCSVLLTGIDTANTSQTNITMFSNISQLVSINLSTSNTNLSSVEDGTYKFNVTCLVVNQTGDGNLSTFNRTLQLYVDNTIPQAPSTLTSGTVRSDNDRDVVIAGQITNANTTSNGCAITFTKNLPAILGGNTFNGSISGTNCSYTILGANDGTFCFTMRASDGRNTSDSSESCFEIDLRTGKSKQVLVANALAKQQAEAAARNSGGLFGGSGSGQPLTQNQKVVGGLAVGGLILWLLRKRTMGA